MKTDTNGAWQTVPLDSLVGKELPLKCTICGTWREWGRGQCLVEGKRISVRTTCEKCNRITEHCWVLPSSIIARNEEKGSEY